MIHILAGLAGKQAGNLAGYLGLAGLPVASLGLVWPGPVLPALPWPGPATTTGRLRQMAAAAARLLLLSSSSPLLLDQAKARQARQAQARPSQGKACWSAAFSTKYNEKLQY